MDKKYALLVKNFEKDLNLLKAILPNALETKPFGRKRALVSFANREEANAAYAKLSAAFNGSQTHVKFLQSNDDQRQVKKVKHAKKLHKITRSTQTDWKWKDVGALPEAYIRQVYGIDNDIRLNLPPPGYLYYEYPRATMDIVDAMSIELMKNKSFYVAVLNLMNRMNLEPPFPAKEVYFRRGVPKEVATQTGEETQETKQTLSSSSESELTDEEIKIPLAPPVKRKKVLSEEQIHKKARLMLKGALHTTQLTQETKKKKKKVTRKVFDSVPEKCTKIEIKVPLKPKIIKEPIQEIPQAPFAPPADLRTLKISEEEQKSLPIYVNYAKGEESDKLYIKNLAKNVTTEDLIALYERYVINPADDLHVRVMQQGRMKGQAFVTFQSKTVDNKMTASIALEATNGFKLHERPLVVSFGKKRETS